MKTAREIEYLDSIWDEYERACKIFPKFYSPHEGYAIILEELDELWDLVKTNQPLEMMAVEATQVAAMALRFLLDLSPAGPVTCKKCSRKAHVGLVYSKELGMYVCAPCASKAYQEAP